MNQGIITQTVKYGVKSTKNRGSGDGLTLSAPAAVKITACHFCGFQLYFLCFGRWAPRNRSLEPCQDGNVAALRGSFYVTWIHLAPKFFYYKSKKGGYDAAPRDRECFLETQYVKNIKTQAVVLPEPLTMVPRRTTACVLFLCCFMPRGASHPRRGHAADSRESAHS